MQSTPLIQQSAVNKRTYTGGTVGAAVVLLAPHMYLSVSLNHR
jgi:hypothetical protein